MAAIEVELSIPTQLKGEPIFYQIIKNFEVVPNIIEASFSTEMGWALVTFEAEEKELARLFSFLKEKKIEVKIRD